MRDGAEPDVYAVPGNVTNKNAWGPNTLIKQGAKLTATWEDVWEDLPSQVRLLLEDEAAARRGESGGGQDASVTGAGNLFGAVGLSEHELRVLERLRPDETTQLDTLIEQMDPELGSAEIFAALFELELKGRVRSMPGKNYLRAM